MYPLLISLVTLTLFRALCRCTMRNSCCAYAASSAYFHRPLLTVSCLLLSPSFSTLDLSFLFGHQTFILAPIILGHPTYSDQLSSFYSVSFSGESHATRCIMRASFLSCFAFDNYELTCSTTSPCPYSFLFLSLRSSLCFMRAHHPAFFSLRLIFFISLF